MKMYDPSFLENGILCMGIFAILFRSGYVKLLIRLLVFTLYLVAIRQSKFVF